MVHRRLRILPLALLLGIVAAARGQESAPATIYDSPVAWQLLQQAADQTRENPSEAARLCQRLLDGYADRLVPAEDPDGDRFESVLDAVERLLRRSPATLDRYRRNETAEAARAAAERPAEEIARTRGLTPAGLEAHLIVAERDIDRGRLDTALVRLRRIENHPDLATLAREAATYWYLRGLAATLSGREAERDESLARLDVLRSAEATDARVMLEILAGEGPATVASPSSPLTSGLQSPSSERDWQPVWIEPMAGTPFGRAIEARPEGPFGVTAREADRARFDGSLLVLAPTVVEQALVVSDGTAIRALDQLSRRILWSTEIGPAAPERLLGGGPIGDLGSVAVGEGVAIAFPGHASGNERGPSGRVVCVELDDGRLRWDATLSRLVGNTSEDIFPTGEPVIADGAVHLLARKVTSRLETVDYAVALELADGSLRWATHVASAGGVRVQGLRSISRPVVAEGSLWVTTSVGAIARLDLADGRLIWLRRYLVPVRELRYPSEPWEVAGPALLGSSLFAIVPDQSAVVQLERDSGRLLRAMPLGATNAWGTPRYLLGDPPLDAPDAGPRRPRVYAIGSDIVAFDADDPTRPLWSFAQANAGAFSQSGGDRAGMANRSGIRGRVQLAGEDLVVPGLNDLALVSRDTGRVRDRIEIDGPANPVLVGSQLFLGQNAAVTALMPAASAERFMRERIVARPEDPEGGLALLDLGLRTRRPDLCVEAGRFASAALDARNDAAAREELVERLLRAADLPASETDGADLHAILAENVRTPSQRVRWLLSEGDWLAASGRPADALARYGSILADRELRAVLVRREEPSEIAAGALAVERMASLPPATRAAREAQALADLTSAAGDVDALQEIVAKHAWTAAAVDAALAVGRVASSGQADRSRRSLAALFGAIRGTPDRRLVADDPPSRAAVTALVAIGLDEGWRRSIAELAEVLSVRWGDRRIDLPSGPTSLRELAAGAPPPTARLGLEAGEAFAVEGRLARAVLHAESSPRLDGLLFATDRGVDFRRGPTFEAAWSIELDDRDPTVLLAGGWLGPRLLLWTETPDGAGAALVVASANGAIEGRTPSSLDLLPGEALLDAGRPPSQLMPSEAPYLASQVLPIVAGRHLVLVRRNGDAVGFAIDDLATPLWKATRLLDQVYDVSAQDWGVALGGRLPGPRGGGPPAVVVLDPATGAILSRRRFGRDDDVRWLRLAPTGEAVVGSFARVEAIDAFDPDGRTLWKSSASAVVDSVAAWRFGDTLILPDRSDAMGAIGLLGGETRPDRFRLPARPDLRQPSVRAGGRVGDTAVMQLEDRLLAFTLDGGLVGVDAVAEDRNYLFALPTEKTLLAVNSLGSRQVPSPLTGGMRTEFLYLIHQFVLGEGMRIAGPAARVRVTGQRCDRVAAIDGFLLLSAGATTLVLPFAPDVADLGAR